MTTKSRSRTVVSINEDIIKIFKKHKIKVPLSVDAFWKAVGKVDEVSKKDGRTIRNLVKEWEKAFAAIWFDRWHCRLRIM